MPAWKRRKGGEGASARPAPAAMNLLLAQTQALDELAVALDVLVLQVVEQLAALADEVLKCSVR